MVGMVCLGAIGSGCGSSTSDVKGVVKFNGKNLEGGTVQIQSAKGNVIVADIQSDGTYVAKGVPTGPAKVSISWVDESKMIEMAKMASAAGRGNVMKDSKGNVAPPKMPADAGNLDKIPPKYKNFDTSGLTVEVEGRVTEKNFDLTN